MIVGLGNPGARYVETRHNVGVWFIDELCKKYAVDLRINKNCHGQVGEIPANTCRLLIPGTFMNESGRAVGACARYFRYKPQQILVVHDELDLEPGIVRLKNGGGHGGHNGLRDIIQSLGSRDFWRLRIGVGHPGHKSEVTNYVLGRPAKKEELEIRQGIGRADTVIGDVLKGKMGEAMHSLHTQN